MRPTPIDVDLRCVVCKYNLRGLPVRGRCPECGTTIADIIRKIARRRARCGEIKRFLERNSIGYRRPIAVLLVSLGLIVLASTRSGWESPLASESRQSFALLGFEAVAMVGALLYAARLGLVGVLSLRFTFVACAGSCLLPFGVLALIGYWDVRGALMVQYLFALAIVCNLTEVGIEDALLLCGVVTGASAILVIPWLVFTSLL